MSVSIKPVREKDLIDVMALNGTFGHQMFYSQRPDLMLDLIKRCELLGYYIDEYLQGYYHWFNVTSSREVELMRSLKQMPDRLVEEASSKIGRLSVGLQGASHRGEYKLLIEHLLNVVQPREMWCWCSITSNKPTTFKELGFTFDSKDERTFFNYHKMGISTYRLGRWIRPAVTI